MVVFFLLSEFFIKNIERPYTAVGQLAFGHEARLSYLQ